MTFYADDWDDSSRDNKIWYCHECHQECSLNWEDEGIGAYEYWGATGVDENWQASSDCCEAKVTDNPPDEWFDDE